ncbi:MAG TPA: nitroreductase family protein [Geobacteraceae bacterium]
MDALEAILTRRSVRRYTDEPIAAELLDELLNAAMHAPSAGNEEPWHFVVVTDRETLDAIPRFHPYAVMLRQAPAAVVVCGDPTLEKYNGYWVLDCAAATENLLLAAHARGLGGVWVGVHPQPEREAGVRELLGIPAHVIPFAIVALGHPAERPPKAERFDSRRVHRNRWEG